MLWREASKAAAYPPRWLTHLCGEMLEEVLSDAVSRAERQREVCVSSVDIVRRACVTMHFFVGTFSSVRGNSVCMLRPPLLAVAWRRICGCDEFLTVTMHPRRASEFVLLF